MKLLLIGPYPPPHGGVSVHVAQAYAELQRAGVTCRVLNIDRRAPESPRYINIRGSFDLVRKLWLHVKDGWTFHLHTNGHNFRSWVVALICGLAGRFAPGALLTLHSGMVPAYLEESSFWRRLLVKIAAKSYDRIICVNPAIRAAVASLGIAPERLEVAPAFIPARPAELALSTEIEDWVQAHMPLLSTALFFRPEYGFELLVRALARLKLCYPNFGCVVMGSGEQQAAAENLVRREGMEKQILLLGDVAHEVCLALMSSSDLFVRPTLEDGDAISVREALSLGVPVVASNVGTRPPGTILFKTGDLEDLLSNLEAGLTKPRGPREAAAAAGGAGRLLEIYGLHPAQPAGHEL